MSATILICLPFSGGARHSYKVFEEHLPSHIKLFPIELPGRATRIRENLLVDIHRMVDDIFWQIFPLVNSRYAIYGHSMGTLLGYLTAKRLVQKRLPLPRHLFFTGRKGPSLPETKRRHLLSREDFIAELRELGGSPDEILNNDSLIDYYAPIIRADFQAVETYTYQETTPFDIPITIGIGKDEKTSLEDAQAWQKETNHPIDIHEYPGNHFFIFDHTKELMDLIGNKLLKVDSNAPKS